MIEHAMLTVIAELNSLLIKHPLIAQIFLIKLRIKLVN